MTQMADIIILDDFRPHSNASMLCICGCYWIATYPATCEKLQCPNCSTMVKIQEE
jgi:hypothetical protein